MILSFVLKRLCVSGGPRTRTPHPACGRGFFCIQSHYVRGPGRIPAPSPQQRRVHLRGNVPPLNAYLTRRPYKRTSSSNRKDKKPSYKQKMLRTENLAFCFVVLLMRGFPGSNQDLPGTASREHLSVVTLPGDTLSGNTFPRLAGGFSISFLRQVSLHLLALTSLCYLNKRCGLCCAANFSRGKCFLLYSKCLCVSGVPRTRTPHPARGRGFFCTQESLRSRAELNPSAKFAAKARLLARKRTPLERSSFTQVIQK